MRENGRLDELLAGAFVEADVFRLRPDYRAMLVAVDGIVPSPSDDASDALLQAAEAAAREALDALCRGADPARGRNGARRTGRSEQSPSGPVTAWRLSCGAPRPGCPA